MKPCLSSVTALSVCRFAPVRRGCVARSLDARLIAWTAETEKDPGTRPGKPQKLPNTTEAVCQRIGRHAQIHSGGSLQGACTYGVEVPYCPDSMASWEAFAGGAVFCVDV